MGLYRRTRRRRGGVAVLLATALAVRMTAVFMLAAPPDRPTTYEHGAIAENLLAGRGFTIAFLGIEGPTSQQAPWVPALLAFCGLPFRGVTSIAILAFQVLQCLAGTALCYVAARWGWLSFPRYRSIGWAVGWSAALYPPHVYMVTHVQAAPWAALGLTTLFMLTADPRQAARPRTSSFVGLAAGWLLLVDPIYVLVLPIIAWRLVLSPRSEARTTVRHAVFAFGCALLLVGPWLVRNYVVHGEFVFVKSTFGYAFWQGNNALSWGTDKVPKPSVAAAAAAHDGSLSGQNQALWEARHETLYIDDVLLKPDGYREFVGLSEPARSRLLGQRARRYVVEAPADYARRCLRRLRYFLLWDETNPKTLHPIYRTSSIVWLASAAIGLLAARRRWIVLAPSMLAFAVILTFHALTITSARFRIPLEPIGMLWAAVGLEPPLAHLGRRLRKAWGEAFAGGEARAADEVAAGNAAGLTGPHRRPANLPSRSRLRRR